MTGLREGYFFSLFTTKNFYDFLPDTNMSMNQYND